MDVKIINKKKKTIKVVSAVLKVVVESLFSPFGHLLLQFGHWNGCFVFVASN